MAEDGETVVEQTEFTWDGTTLCEQTTVSAQLPNLVTLTWDHQGLQPVAQTERVRSVDAPQREIDSRFFAIVTDLIGTPTELLDESGEIAWRTRNTLWGITAWEANSSTYTPLRFPGQYYDPETGFHFNYFRHYDAETGHYASLDPLGLDPAPNPVAYVHNPLTWTDHLGLAPVCKFWKLISYRGQRVYQRDDLVLDNPEAIQLRDRYGRSNLKRMQQGLAPLGPDGRPMNVHHMLQTGDGPMAELTHSMHFGNYHQLHWKSGTKIPSGINREEFDLWRKQYWKDRAKAYLESGDGN
jgi:RHS repeat-associated protein